MTRRVAFGIPLGVLAVLSPLLFPVYLAVLIVTLVSLLIPPIALVAGMLADALYYVPGHVFVPYASIAGLLASLIAVFVHDFIKARIISR